MVFSPMTIHLCVALENRVLLQQYGHASNILDSNALIRKGNIPVLYCPLVPHKRRRKSNDYIYMNFTFDYSFFPNVESH